MADNDTKRRGLRRLGRRRSRLAVGAVLVALASTLATVGTSSAARADTPSCPPGLDWSFNDNGFFPEYFAIQYVVDSVKPDFLVSEQRVVDNGTNAPITGSFTSSVSKTFALTFTAGVSGSVFGLLTGSVSSSISMSTTTMTGVTATAPVPAGGRVIGQYGVEAYDVTYTINEWDNIGNNPPGPLCSLSGSTQGTSVAPTTLTGWRVIPG